MTQIGYTGETTDRTGYSWFPCYPYNSFNTFLISKSRFDFPDSLKVYYSRRYPQTWSLDQACDIFTSDTITVNEKCDSLYAQLNAKVAFFYAKNPPQHFLEIIE